MTRKKIVVATKNLGKVREMMTAFQNLDVELFPLSDFQNIPEAEETGKTFLDNAIQKAAFYSKQLQLPCLADDSGLEVDALDGMPGVLSARFAGYHADDETNNQKLLQELALRKKNSSPAQYVCALAFVDGEKIITTQASCRGEILIEANGTNGFGYDPYFYVVIDGEKKSFAQISLSEKNKLSHRGKALRQMEELLKNNL